MSEEVCSLARPAFVIGPRSHWALMQQAASGLALMIVPGTDGVPVSQPDMFWCRQLVPGDAVSSTVSEVVVSRSDLVEHSSPLNIAGICTFVEGT